MVKKMDVDGRCPRILYSSRIEKQQGDAETW